MLRLCKRCGREFEPKTKYTIVCPDCHEEIKHMPTMSNKICKICGVEFSGGPRAKYCPDCRAERAKEASRENKRNGAARKLGSTDICEWCGMPYTVNSGKQKYCPNCKDEAVYETVKRRKIRREKIYRSKYPDGRKPRKVCLICGREFSPGTPAKTCSKKCGEELQRRRLEEKKEAKA